MRPVGTISDAMTPCRPGRGEGRPARAAFTLVELLVTMVIIAILASLTLAGLGGVRQRAKADKTRNTIRKIDAVIRPMYDSYRNRRVTSAAAGLTARNYYQMLLDKRKLVTYEMPDQWTDVPTASDVSGAQASVPAPFRTTTVRAYAANRPASPNSVFSSAECLYMILERSGYESDALEFFRSDEIGDVDKDGRNEFLDGWGRPIAFLRWAPGFTSPIQQPDAVNAHDPLDPTGRDPTAYALVPLIYSAGPDGALGTPSDDTTGYGVQALSAGGDGKGWLSSDRLLVPVSGTPDEGLCTSPKNQVSGRRVGEALPVTPDTTSLDNITNHDLLKK
jgi:prepilin-type N-terminal cleavage/methylation domain-containing protein